MPFARPVELLFWHWQVDKSRTYAKKKKKTHFAFYSENMLEVEHISSANI